MTTKRKRRISGYERLLLQIAQLYVEETGITEYDLPQLAEWAVTNGKCDLPVADCMRELRRDFARAFRNEYISDDDGEPVRKNHAFRQPKTQKLLWKPIEDLNPEEMGVSTQMIRNGVRETVLQQDRNLRYFNDKINPGDPITPDWNFNHDIAESRLPLEYPDAPPETEEGQQD